LPRIGDIGQFDQGGAALLCILVTAAKVAGGGKGLQKMGGVVIQRHEYFLLRALFSGAGLNIRQGGPNT